MTRNSRYPVHRAAGIGLIAALAAVALGIWLWQRPAGPRPKHVLILSVESLRWDHLGFAGYARPTSPNIDALVARGTCFRRAYAQAPWTRPSVASTFTSTYPSTHNAANDVKFDAPEGKGEDGSNDASEYVMTGLADSFTTMAELFRAHGYRCFGWSCNGQISQELGFAQGFDEYDGTGELFLQKMLIEKYGSKDRIPAGVTFRDVTTRDFRGVVDELIVERLTGLFRQKDRAPTIAFVHFMSPHFPYLPAEEFRKPFTTVADGVRISEANHDKISKGEIRLTDADIAYNIDLYDATIREIDAHVGQILDLLNDSGHADETLVVLMADHGEEFYDHGAVGHGHSIYEELIRVPMVLAGPGIPAGKSVSVPVQNIDLLPTLAGLLWDEELPWAQGRDLRRLLGDNPPASMGLVFSEHGMLPGEVCAVIDGPWKLIARQSKSGDRVIGSLFNLSADPGETTNLFGGPEHMERVKGLWDAVLAYVAGNLKKGAKHERAVPVRASKALMDQLRALGYVK